MRGSPDADARKEIRQPPSRQASPIHLPRPSLAPLPRPSLAGSSCITSLFSIYAATLHVVDTHHCFRQDRLLKKGKSAPVLPRLKATFSKVRSEGRAYLLPVLTLWSCTDLVPPAAGLMYCMEGCRCLWTILFRLGQLAAGSTMTP